MIKWIPVEELPEEDELVVVRCKSGYKSSDYVFITARYNSVYRPYTPWTDAEGEALDDQGLVPLDYTRDLDHFVAAPGTKVIEETSTEGIEPEFHSIIKEYGRSLFATLINASQASAAVEALMALSVISQNTQAQLALKDFISAFNQLSVAYLAEMPWTDERVEACQKEILAVMETAILKATPAIIGADGHPLTH